MFPWSDHCHHQRARRRRRLGEDEHDLLDKWDNDVCCGGEDQLPEVEIISLVQEQIPKYKLKADVLTSFAGYENLDWYIPSPALKPEEISPLTPEQIRETLNYFLLCSRRVSQMTKTYSDIEAVTRLLEEKEKDLELTARIGKELLGQNARLEGQVHELEAELNKTRETITQLQHEILRKSELIQVMTNDSTPVSEDEQPVWAGTLGLGEGRVIDGFKLLERKISALETDNDELRREAERLAVKTEESEAQETKLVADLMARLQEERGASSGRDLELERLRQAVAELQDSLDSLHARLEMQTCARETAEKERDEYLSKWAIGRETEAELVSELADLKEKYGELVNYMDEVKDSMKKTTKKKGPTVRTGPTGFPSLGAVGGDCLASELETSLLSELSLDSGISGTSSLGGLGGLGSLGGLGGTAYRRAMDTVRCSATIVPTVLSGGMSELSSPLIPPPTPPAPSDLEAAVRSKLTPHAIESRRRALSSLHDAPYDCLTPDSLLSGSMSLGASSCWKLPERLQIVKPVEGSMTLHHWSKLATPSLGGLLEDHPGVRTRGGADLETLGFTLHSLSDMEEDDETTHPGKSFQESNYVFTYTNSTVRYHTSTTSVTHSYRGSQVSSVVSSAVPSLCSTPRGLSRRSSVTSLSSLANAPPPPVITTTGITATPPPSPTRSLSPDPSDTDDEYSYSALGLPGFLMTSGAELLKRTLGSALKSPTTPKPKALIRPDNKAALTGIRLVETLERIGLEEILATGPSSTLHQAGLRRRIAESTATGGVLGLPATSPTATTNPPPSKTGERRRRPDLGSVPAQPPTPTHRPQTTAHSALGTLSSLLFGRKGGLL